jgi:hypothetical protein
MRDTAGNCVSEEMGREEVATCEHVMSEEEK